ncbi:MAG: AhpC/TSA family protein [Bacteroidales bacterium]|nr:AhpC/TSA family protein [Bacteroidales bacterium]
MKRILTALAAVALLVSCGGKTYTLKGTVDPVAIGTGDFVIIADNISQQVDTVQIVEGKFTFKGPASVETIKNIILVAGGVPDNAGAVMFIPEGGTIAVDLDAGKVQGGALNKALDAYNTAVAGILNDYSTKARELSGSLAGAELAAAMDKVADDAQAKLDKVNMETFTANKRNALGFITLADMIYDFETAEEFDQALEGAADFIVNYEPFNDIRASLRQLANTAEGQMFADFKGETVDGKPISFSDYVGKGKWILVDFWASWCGPCKAELPNILAVYDKYAGKDFTVIGVPVWDVREDTDQAIKDLGIKYEQIFVGDDHTPTEVYGINGIPHIILFAPDGRVAKRNLRGAHIEEAVKEALQI